jgi:hypothetical protein
MSDFIDWQAAENAGDIVIPGRGLAREPGIQEQGPKKLMLDLYSWVPGPALASRPGMTEQFFSIH